MDPKTDHFEVIFDINKMISHYTRPYYSLPPGITNWCSENCGIEYYDWGLKFRYEEAIFWFSTLEHATLFKLTWG